MNSSSLIDLAIAVAFWIVSLYEFWEGYIHLKKSHLEVIIYFLFLLFLRYAAIYQIGRKQLKYNQTNELVRRKDCQTLSNLAVLLVGEILG